MATDELTRREAPVTGTVGGRPRWGRWLAHVGLIVFGLLMLYPLLWMVSSSFKPTTLIFSDFTLWPRQSTLSNYAEGWNAFGLPFSFGKFFVNSLVIAGGAIMGNLLACSLAAYAFARIDFSFKKVWFTAMLATIMLPYHVVAVPQYIMFNTFGWVNTFYPLIAPKFLATDAFFIFLMVQFIRSLPRELDDAAAVDGCGPFQTYWRVILPLTLPALATTAIFTFIWSWNDFFSPLIYLTQPSLYTVSLGLSAFRDATGESAWGQLFAMATLSLVPVFGFFLSAQRYLVRGIATTGLK